ncbi:uncharacterized protein LOC142978901 isoform X2 [Anticarsia gemmatalis]|uniref:uncharacterized protein LOC142978901 isoform X2 n=1 Tax=Anticarsia gemmatalis TaxID=129554 RepID=UPI003F757F48
MLISKVPEDDAGRGVGCEPAVESNTHEYQTASELFELMAKNQNFNTNDGDTLTPRDLVLLYKNIDLGTKLMSSAKEMQCEKPNQYVETVIYNDDPDTDGSDLSDVYSNEDMQNVFLVNKERIDLLDNPPSLENTLCHKFGDLEIQTSVTDYDRQFIFKDPYIEEQLKNFNLFSTNETEGTVLPASLLDYVCCKRLEDNYNFYMENIIRYVKNTIEQLKRISNGDYLTDKAKEKWREVEQVDNNANNTKVLATSTSIPLHVECKVGGRKTTWDDIVHSAVDIRSLSKILEKKIVIEIPKLISGSFKLLSKCGTDNLIISCKKENKMVESKESRVDVVFQLKRSDTGYVMSNISSIMILKNTPLIPSVHEVLPPDSPLPLMYKQIKDTKALPEKKVKITEINSSTESVQEGNVDYDHLHSEEGHSDSFDCLSREYRTPSIQEDLSESSDTPTSSLLNGPLVFTQKEASFDVCPDDLRMTIQKLAIQSTLTEESEDTAHSVTKKRSPTRVRIKSPYENKSFIIEEKKRKKLLEIREKRERKKMALAENCKITKHKYSKGPAMPQTTSSVTKLSITNKSFYNSIYGQAANIDPKQVKNKQRKDKKELLEVALENIESEQEATPRFGSEKNSKKFINRSYYLDDAVTEMMYMNMKQKEKENEICSASTSGSNDFQNNLNMLSALIAPCESEPNDTDDTEDNSSFPKTPRSPTHVSAETNDCENRQDCRTKDLSVSQSKLHISSPVNSLPRSKGESDKNSVKNKAAASVECRKSIDKIYQLMKKIGKPNDSGTSSPPFKLLGTGRRMDITGARGNSLQGSDSGTSLKHLTSSNPSTFSFEKVNNIETAIYNKKPASPTNVVPKVIISSKSHIPIPKAESDKVRSSRKPMGVSPPVRVQENPLKAISQILHEFENVQRTRLKSGSEQKNVKKGDATVAYNDGKNNLRPIPYRRRSRLEQHNDAMDKHIRIVTPRDKRSKPISGMEVPKIPYQHVAVDDRYSEKTGKKKITDILDEAKEARGEAVRGPSKFNSRLNSLAQPKRSYVQAHSEEYQTRYGRNIITDRLQRLAAAPSPTSIDRVNVPPPAITPRTRARRSSNDTAGSPVSLKAPGVPIERQTRLRMSRNSSPDAKTSSGIGPSYKQNNVPETPEILKKKMVAVESYVKSHYGRASSALESQNPHKSRAPLLPNDIDIASTSSSPLPQESTEVGIKLHRMIDSMIKNAGHGLEVVTECHETNSRSSKQTNDDGSINENTRGDERISTGSEYTTGTTDDMIVLTANNISDNVDMTEQPIDAGDCQKLDIQPFKSATGLQKSELDLDRALSVGTFKKHIRMHSVSPKPSIQQLFLYQSGDAGSLVVKTSISQNIQTDKLLDWQTSPLLSKTHLDWSFTKIPMQITTVGYAFPEYNNAAPNGPPGIVKILGGVSKNPTDKSPVLSQIFRGKPLSSEKSPKTIKCCKDVQYDFPLQQSAQIEAPKLNKVPTNESCSHKIAHDVACGPKNEDFENVVKHDKVKICKESNAQTVNIPETNSKEVELPTDPDSVDYTTSLDILVGLLNEIKKITTCQTNITNNNENPDSKELEMILNNTGTVENSTLNTPYEEISITSLDKLRGLESNPSVYSFYLSDNEKDKQGRQASVTDICPWYNLTRGSFRKPVCADKQVSADLTEKEFVNRLTDIPSLFFPVNISHSTNMTNSMVKELCVTTSHSLLSMADFQSTFSTMSSLNSTYSDASSKNIIKLPRVINNTKHSNQSLVCYKSNWELKQTVKEKPRCDQKNRLPEKDLNIVKKVKKPRYNNCLKSSEFDPVMKMKRDILVTLYSMLVLTVFAALSLPEMYRV